MSRLHVKLDIQRFAVKMTKITATTLEQSTSGNYSKVRITCVLERTKGTTYWEHPYERTLTITCDGQTKTQSTTFPQGGGVGKQVTYYSDFDTIYHNQDGTKSISFSGNIPARGTLNEITGSGSATLATIPRYFSSSPTLTVQSKTETSITFKWTTPEGCDQAQYKIGSGGTWIDIYSGGATTSGTYTVSGLSADTQYTFYGDYKRADSQLWSTHGGYTVSTSPKTYDYPKAEEITAFTIGVSKNNVIKLNNPLNRQVTITLNLSNNNTYTLYNGNWNGYISPEFFTTEATTALYNSIPSARSGTYNCSVYCSTTSTTKNSDTNTYSIKNDGTENPTFDASNWSYVADLISLTNNNQVVINGQSTLTFTVGTAAQAKYGASIKEYRFKWGNASVSSTIGYTVPQGNGNILTVEAVDTRELSTVTTKTLSSGVTYIPYLIPTLEYNFCNTHRTDGVTAEVKLNLYGSISVTKFGTTGENNELSTAEYRVYDYDISDWTQYYTIPISEFTYTDNTFRLTDYLIHKNGSSGGFTVGKRYLVQIKLRDGDNLLGTFTSQDLQITDGKLARDVYQDVYGDYHQGINGLADDNYTNTIYGDINVIGDYYQNGQPFSGGGGGVSGDTLPIGSQIPYGSTNIPNNWLLCDGSAVSRTDYAQLFNVIGTSYGAGDGSTTFNLPDKRGRKSVGYNINDTDFNSIGKKGGEKTHKLTVYEMPSHNHTVKFDQSANSGLAWLKTGGNSGGPYYSTDYVGNSGSDQPHNNEDPYETDCWIIKAFQSAGVVAEVSNEYSQSTTNTYSCNYVNGKTKKKFIKVRATQNKSIATAGTLNIDFQVVDMNEGNAFQLVNGLVQIIDPTVTKVKVTLTAWVELGNNSYAWCHIGTQNASWNNWIEYSSYMQPPTTQVWHTITNVAICSINTTNNFISPSIFFNNASSDNSVRGGTYSNSVYMIVEVMD